MPSHPPRPVVACTRAVAAAPRRVRVGALVLAAGLGMAAACAARADPGVVVTEPEPAAAHDPHPLPSAAPMAAATAVATAAVDAIATLPQALQRIERGIASWYGQRFHGKPTASGQPFDMHGQTAAHRTLPLGSRLVVRNPANGREVEVLINDRGPFHPGRLIDLSHAAAKALGVLHRPSEVELLQPADAPAQAPATRQRR